jgi:hypothetical protein
VKEVFGIFIKGVFCSFLRTNPDSLLTYVVTAEVDNTTISCRIIRDQMKTWSVADPNNEPFFVTNAKELIRTINENENGNIVLIELPLS